jgi:hypothetical protein
MMRAQHRNHNGRPAYSSTTLAICAAAAMAGGVTLAAAIATTSSAWQRPGLFVFFTIVLAVFQTAPLRLRHGGETETLQLEETFVIPMALLLSPLETVLGIGLAVAFGHVWERRDASKTLFNLGQMITAAGVGVLVSQLLGAETGRVAVRDVVAGVGGAIAFVAVSTVMVATVIGSVRGIRFISVIREGGLTRLVVWAGSISLGVLAVMATARDVWAVAALIAPVALISVMMPELANEETPVS